MSYRYAMAANISPMLWPECDPWLACYNKEELPHLAFSNNEAHNQSKKRETVRRQPNVKAIKEESKRCSKNPHGNPSKVIEGSIDPLAQRLYEGSSATNGGLQERGRHGSRPSSNWSSKTT